MNQLSRIPDAPAFSLDDLIRHDRVHTKLYIDPDIFEREIERIFESTWLFIGHAGETPEKGDFRRRTMGRQPVIFVRDQNGKVQVLMNRCTHRANAVCTLDRGNAPGFTCSYHGWRFRLDGELAAVPYADRYGEEFDKSKLGLTPVPHVAEHRGFVFASLNPDVVPLDEHFGPLVRQELDDIADLSPEGHLDITAGYHHLRFAGNWKLQVENVIDGYHANFAHRAYFENVKRRTGTDPSPLGSSSAPATVHSIGRGHGTWDSRPLIAASGRQEQPGNPEWADYVAAMVKAHGKERTEYLLSKQGSHLFIFPNFSYTGVHFRQFRPLAVDYTEFTLFPIMLKGAPDSVNERRLRGHEAFYGPCALGGQSDDLEVFERNQIGLNAELYPWSLLSRGIHLEKRQADGSIANQITDELSNRAFWARYKQEMTA
ncbi:MAG: aromatic ring-hydroxylating dioxygenase subunit alpha [Novosphingobium sp.]|nr:aromatic ring-hydroxylating dioxygenase subunit alpha [Novosphingobium sp.]